MSISVRPIPSFLSVSLLTPAPFLIYTMHSYSDSMEKFVFVHPNKNNVTNKKSCGL